MVRDGVRRDGFLATLGSRTWRPRAFSAGVLADLDALSSSAGYTSWLSRIAPAWSCLPPAPAGTGQAWPLVCVGPDCLGGLPELDADLADQGAMRAAVDRPRGGGVADEAFLVGAAYVAVVAACDAAVLIGAARMLARREPAVGTRFLEHCERLTSARASFRRELSAWAADSDPATRERAVLTARTLSLELAEAVRP
jgi:hypothetical protein